MSEIANSSLPKVGFDVANQFTDINPPLTQAEAILEANRCLYCYDAPCIPACPTHIDIPSFIKKIATGNLEGSARVIFDSNPIGGTCARVCPVEVLCEGACVEKTLVNKPIQIGRLQRHATDHAIKNGTRVFDKKESNGRKIAIVGSGPAGLSCATYLAREGFDVTVFEKRPLAGGLNTYGMAEYKMTQSESLQEVRLIENLGVRFETDSEITTDRFSRLVESYDAVFIATGLGKTRVLGIPGEEKIGVIDPLAFIESIKTREWTRLNRPKSVVVIGAGNTAIDAVTQAKRLGAESGTIVYRRSEREAPAYEYEMNLARKDGIHFMWNTTPIEILGDESVTGIRCKTADGKEVVIECDLIIPAIGQEKTTGFFSSIGISTDEDGRVTVNEEFQTSVPKVFAGGDCVNGGTEAVYAAQEGKLAAWGIRKMLIATK
jgi:dihydropyrimidine dehydrogenase (NAD+) subunit PreT